MIDFNALPFGIWYELPAGWTFEDLATARAKWNISTRYTATVPVPGIVAWGAIMPSEYRLAPAI